MTTKDRPLSKREIACAERDWIGRSLLRSAVDQGLRIPEGYEGALSRLEADSETWFDFLVLSGHDAVRFLVLTEKEPFPSWLRMRLSEAAESNSMAVVVIPGRQCDPVEYRLGRLEGNPLILAVTRRGDSNDPSSLFRFRIHIRSDWDDISLHKKEIQLYKGKDGRELISMFVPCADRPAGHVLYRLRPAGKSLRRTTVLLQDGGAIRIENDLWKNWSGAVPPIDKERPPGKPPNSQYVSIYYDRDAVGWKDSRRLSLLLQMEEIRSPSATMLTAGMEADDGVREMCWNRRRNRTAIYYITGDPLENQVTVKRLAAWSGRPI